MDRRRFRGSGVTNRHVDLGDRSVTFLHIVVGDRSVTYRHKRINEYEGAECHVPTQEK